MPFKNKRGTQTEKELETERAKRQGKTETVQIEPEKEEIKELTETEKIIILNSEIWYKAQIIELLSEILKRQENGQPRNEME